MTSPHDPAPDAPRSPWFARQPPALQPAVHLVPVRPTGEMGAPIYEQMVAEFGDPLSPLGPIRARFLHRSFARPAGD
ncbi:hypothetical protein [Kitasatospora sp. NPDC087314]|uniref:hypothetical protein n=1 Tax=Kitasatospora sp. NPDC087314 TaxID=3364068 RepID=UPI00382501DD